MKKITFRQIIGALVLFVMIMTLIAIFGTPSTSLDDLSQPDKVMLIVCQIIVFVWIFLSAVSKVFMIRNTKKNPFAAPSVIVWAFSVIMLISAAYSINLPGEPNTPFINLCCTLFLFFLPAVDVAEAFTNGR